MAELTSRELELLARRLEPELRKAFVQAIVAARNDAAAVQALADLLRAGRVEQVLTALGMDAARLSPLAEAMRSAFVAGAGAGLQEIPPVRLLLDPVITGIYRPRSPSPVPRASFDLRNPAAER